MFKKKFLMRLVRTSDTSCYVEYSYSRVIPCWTRFQKWMYMLRSWGTVVLTYEEAKIFASQFESIEDVDRWNAEQQALKTQYPDPNYDTPIIEYLGGE